MNNKVKEIVVMKEFFGEQVRVVNGNIVLKDFFMALGRLRADGQIETKDRNKLKKIVGEENVKKIKIPTISEKNGAVCQTYVSCVDMDIIEKHDIEKIFAKNKGFIYCGYREENYFYGKVLDFFKYDKHVKIGTQVKCMEFRLDMTIGRSVIVEFDESHHEKTKEADMIRMKKIALAKTFDERNYLYDTNDYNDVNVNIIEDNCDFTMYDLNSVMFVRVRNANCLNWIPLVYGFHDEYIESMYSEFNCLFKETSDKLINAKFVG